MEKAILRPAMPIPARARRAATMVMASPLSRSACLIALKIEINAGFPVVSNSL
jgi:hypothetical protein